MFEIDKGCMFYPAVSATKVKFITVWMTNK
jgi:hypothetical protein